MSRYKSQRRGVAWLELLLALAFLSLLFQIVGPKSTDLWQFLDIRNWSSRMWFGANALFFTMLCAIKYGPGIAADFKASRDSRRTAQAARSRSESDAERKKRLAEERTLYQRLKEARQRRVW